MKKKELEDKTVAELRALAKKAGISLKANKKAEIITEVIKGSKTVKKPKAAAPKKQTKKISPKKKTPAAPAKKVVATRRRRVMPHKKKLKTEIPKKETKKVTAKKNKSVSLAKTPKTKPIPPQSKKEAVPVPKAVLPLVPTARLKEKAIKAKEAHLRVYPALPIKDLSPEYSEDTVIALTLEPTKIFVYWEIKKDTMDRLKGRLTLRVYDVTGVAEPSQAHSLFDIGVSTRIGSIYIEVMALKEFLVDAGIMGLKGFSTLIRSNRVSTSPRAPSKKGTTVLPEKYYKPPKTGGWY